MFVMDLPNLPPQYTPVVLAQSPQAKQTNATTDRTIGVCHLIENPPIPAGSAINAISPVTSVWEYLKKQERPTPKQLTAEMFNTAKTSVLQGPGHGTLKDEGDGYYGHHPAPDYFGQDRATILVEIGGLKVKVMYFFNVMQRVLGGTDGYDPREDKKNCPKGRMWKISLSPVTELLAFQDPVKVEQTRERALPKK
jgi:hypothetical protein